MSQTSMGLTDPPQEQEQGVQSPLAVSYIPTDDERRVFQECARESFWYRALPVAAVAMSTAQVLVKKGVFAPSPRFGSLPKVAIFGLFGYFGGQISYTKKCEEKFKMLENSPIGDAIRQRKRPIAQQIAPPNQSQFADPNQASFEQAFQSVTEPRFQADSFSYPSDVPESDLAGSFSPSLRESATTGVSGDINQPVKKNQYGDAWDE